MTYSNMWRRLAQIYEEGEAKAIARLVYEQRYHLTLADLCIGKDTQLSANCQAELEEITQRLERHEPVQYVLGHTEFYGRPFIVTPAVLIPRPETQELCQWVVEAFREDLSEVSILDIGTGSGCIAITLAAELPGAKVTAWDISADALAIARENALRNNVHVNFELRDALNCQLPSVNCHLSTIISNPPYICHKEKTQMETNVLEHEPATALFVPDDDPLLFYRAIARYGLTALKPGGSLYFEINPLYVAELREMLQTMCYRDIQTRNDQYGKTRMLKARL